MSRGVTAIDDKEAHGKNRNDACAIGNEPDVLSESEREGEEEGSRIMSAKEARCVLLGLLHAADLGNCIKPVQMHVKWSVQVVQEFFHEGNVQKVTRIDLSFLTLSYPLLTSPPSPIPCTPAQELSMDPLPFMDATQCYLPNSQMEFLDFVARPLFTTVARILPELSDFPEALDANYTFWASMAVSDKAALGLPDLPPRVRPRSWAERVFSPRTADRQARGPTRLHVGSHTQVHSTSGPSNESSSHRSNRPRNPHSLEAPMSPRAGMRPSGWSAGPNASPEAGGSGSLGGVGPFGSMARWEGDGRVRGDWQLGMPSPEDWVRYALLSSMAGEDPFVGPHDGSYVVPVSAEVARRD